MTKFASYKNSWFNSFMKNTETSIKDKIVSRYLQKDDQAFQPKSSDINVLLNRIELNKKNESRKKLYFSAAASTGLILFGFLIF
mgnify:CR=1 FL=1|tara:strand:+ start:425 stop:676 length:252 start_codon:yes stop_codon:yes gene_type:complete